MANVALSPGGVHSEGPAASADHLSTYPRPVLGFRGIDDVDVVHAGGAAMGEERSARRMKAAQGRMETLFT